MLTKPADRLSSSPKSTSGRCCRSTAASPRRSSSTANLTADDLRFLAAHDSDPFNRWQALQTLATRAAGRQCRDDPRRRRAGTMRADRCARRRSSPTRCSSPLSSRWCWRMPSEADIAREIGRDIDPDAIFARAQHLRAAIGTHLAATLAKIYRRAWRTTAPYSPDAASAGRRALKNICARSAGRHRRRRCDRARASSNIEPPTT
ncbi:MAG: aminopeptidase N C-terminal domain-containing protein [Nitrospira sp.]